MKLGTTVIVAVLWTGYPTPALASSERSSTPPRYQLKVGQEFAYHSASSASYRPGHWASTRNDRTDWQIWVVRQNRDGSWRLILQWNYEWWVTYGQGKRKESTFRSSVVTFDLFANGRIICNDRAENGPNPADLFPRLADDAQAALKGWETVSEQDGRRSRFTTPLGEKTEGTLWAFDEVREDPLDPFFLMTWRCRFLFDAGRGLIQRAQTESTQDNGVRGKQTGITELKAVKERDPVWIRQLAEQADHFLLAGKTYRNLIARAQRERNSALLAEAESTLKKARDKITVPFLRVEADDALKTHQSLLKAYDDEEKHRVAVISKPAAKWKTKDLAGKTHALADYRGKVVILDFWYRRCAYCLKAMPQVARIAREFKDEPVAVLGVNVDEVETDARFVVDKLKLLYPVLKAGELPTTYEVSAYPTLIVIDQTGKVHSVYEGCVPNLHEEVTKAIRALLTSSGTSPGR